MFAFRCRRCRPINSSQLAESQIEPGPTASTLRHQKLSTQIAQTKPGLEVYDARNTADEVTEESFSLLRRGERRLTEQTLVIVGARQGSGYMSEIGSTPGF